MTLKLKIGDKVKCIKKYCDEMPTGVGEVVFLKPYIGVLFKEWNRGHEGHYSKYSLDFPNSHWEFGKDYCKFLVLDEIKSWRKELE